MQYLCYQRVIYNVGTEILMLQRNLHNSTQEARTELSPCVPKSENRELNNEIGPSAVATTKKKDVPLCSLKNTKNMDCCRRRHNKLKLLCSNAHNSTLNQQKSILNTDFEIARRVENVGDTPRLSTSLFLFVFFVLFKRLRNI